MLKLITGFREGCLHTMNMSPIFTSEQETSTSLLTLIQMGLGGFILRSVSKSKLVTHWAQYLITRSTFPPLSHADLSAEECNTAWTTSGLVYRHSHNLYVSMTSSEAVITT